jgi:hypothetical protein
MSITPQFSPLSYNHTIHYNQELAKTITSDFFGELSIVKVLCLNESFYLDPIAHLINEMINRGVGMAREDDGSRSAVIGKIPGFIDKLSSLDY